MMVLREGNTGGYSKIQCLLLVHVFMFMCVCVFVCLCVIVRLYICEVCMIAKEVPCIECAELEAPHNVQIAVSI